MSGQFVVLEGVDGVGKTTQVGLLSNWLEAEDVPHISVREPGGTAVGEAIRELVLGRAELEVPAESELFLILAARAALVQHVIRPALREGKLVLADRFALSTLAYQGYGRGLEVTAIRSALDLATAGLAPDLYVVIDLPAAELSERGRRVEEAPDRIEREGKEFRSRVREAYLALSKSEPRVRVVSGLGTPDEVHQRIRNLLEGHAPRTLLHRPPGSGEPDGG